MENWILNVILGLTVGIIISYILNEVDYAQNNNSKNNKKRYYQKQHQYILNELSSKCIGTNALKENALKLMYEYSISKSRFNLKDIEWCTKALQAYYLENLNFSGIYKSNFPKVSNFIIEAMPTLQILKIINEGMYNASIHSNANFIFTIVSIENNSLNIITHDNGVGYDRKVVADGSGIQTIKNATRNLNGDIKLTSTLGNGTVVNVTVPILKKLSHSSIDHNINIQSVLQSPR